MYSILCNICFNLLLLSTRIRLSRQYEMVREQNTCKEEFRVKLGNDMKRCRFEHDGISQQALANEIGVTRLTIHSIETGKFVPSTLLALKLARFFGKTVEEIFFLEGDGSSVINNNE